MEKHACEQQKEIGSMLAIMDRIVKEFYGDGGKEGVFLIVNRMESKISQLSELSIAQSTLISGLTKAVTEIDTIKKYEHDKKERAIKKTAVYVSGIIGASSIITTLLIKLL